MEKTLYINGDSWSWAKDLSDQHLWCNIVGKHFEYQVVNGSIGCGSNGRIVDSLDNLYLSGHRPDYIVLLLTDHMRVNLPAPNFGTWSIGTYVALNDRTGQTEPKLCEWFFRHGYEELDSIYRYFRTVWRLVECCQRLGCGYKIFRAWGDTTELMMMKPSTDLDQILSNFDVEKYYRDQYKIALTEIRKQSLHWHYIDLPVSSGFNSTDYDATGHPAQTGHAKIAQTVISYLSKDIK